MIIGWVEGAQAIQEVVTEAVEEAVTEVMASEVEAMETVVAIHEEVVVVDMVAEEVLPQHLTLEGTMA